MAETGGPQRPAQPAPLPGHHRHRRPGYGGHFARRRFCPIYLRVPGGSQRPRHRTSHRRPSGLLRGRGKGATGTGRAPSARVGPPAPARTSRAHRAAPAAVLRSGQQRGPFGNIRRQRRGRGAGIHCQGPIPAARGRGAARQCRPPPPSGAGRCARQAPGGHARPVPDPAGHHHRRRPQRAGCGRGGGGLQRHSGRGQAPAAHRPAHRPAAPGHRPGQQPRRISAGDGSGGGHPEPPAARPGRGRPRHPVLAGGSRVLRGRAQPVQPHLRFHWRDSGGDRGLRHCQHTGHVGDRAHAGNWRPARHGHAAGADYPALRPRGRTRKSRCRRPRGAPPATRWW